MTRSHSGQDESRNNLHDPTIRDRELGRDLKKDPLTGKTTEMGSHERKSGQEGDESDDTVVAGDTVERERQD